MLSQNKPNNQNNGHTTNNGETIKQYRLINSDKFNVILRSTSTISINNGISYKI